jgi:hypothetical protein
MFSPTTKFDWYYDPPDDEQPCALRHKKCGHFISPKAIRIESGKTMVGSEWETTESWEIFWCKHCHEEVPENKTSLVFP